MAKPRQSRTPQVMWQFFHWVKRCLLSSLLWQFAVTAILVVLICVLVHTGSLWLTADNLQILLGGQSTLRDLHTQVR
jgi:hypothetical protein